MGISMSTLIGWAAVLGVIGAYTYREHSKNRRAKLARADAQWSRQERQNANARKELKEAKVRENKPKRAIRTEDATQGSSYAAKLKAAPPAAAPAQPASANYSYSSDDDTANNREFARQLASVKQGTKFAGKAKDETRQKSVKQSRAEELPVTGGGEGGRISAPSSTAGIDADDDRSSVASPVVGAVEVGVEDMLEPKAPGPSVLRLTDTQEKTAGKIQKPKAAPEPAETKKQRQNRKKAELAKAEREAAEKDRRVKLEAQRRTARQAEGRSAKDGSAFVAAQANQANAWTNNGTNGKPKSPPAMAAPGVNGFLPVQPLDTYDANAVQTDASKSSVPSYDKGEEWMSSLPSEEEQMELLRKDDEDAWSTVKTKPRKTKNKELTAEKAGAGVAPEKATSGSSTAVSTTGATSTLLSEKKRPVAISKPSSFAALSVSNPADEQEEEWDV
ncbi:hypothetical protein SPI_00785 [Niveomyces insectorum RCEF 264]|uniref:Uncharacterized protein n=1 Tax=Niveomyces insectorum RCEF 264 TaxID=1081102 RepID=A0A168AD66_9HYPO|nr:hypothetical protein SPI_00785 [Niveomyces insectorum RCEF 264]